MICPIFSSNNLHCIWSAVRMLVMTLTLILMGCSGSREAVKIPDVLDLKQVTLREEFTENNFWSWEPERPLNEIVEIPAGELVKCINHAYSLVGDGMSIVPRLFQFENRPGRLYILFEMFSPTSGFLVYTWSMDQGLNSGNRSGAFINYFGFTGD